MTPQDVLAAPSLGEMLRRSCRCFADRPAQMRPGKEGFTTRTYAELWQDVAFFARGLSALGLAPGDRVVILGESCWEWGCVDWACQTLGLTTVPVYPTLPPDQAAYIFRDSEAKAAVCLGPKMAAKLEVVEGKVLLVHPAPGFDSLDELAEKGSLPEAGWEESLAAIDEEALATIIYTSGTTGLPKGAMLPHRCFTHMNKGVFESLPITCDDTFLSFLPLAHVFERYAGHVLPVSVGACVAYAGSLASLGGDMIKVRPTIMLCVPRFLEATRGRIVEGMKKQKPVNQKLFAWTLQQGKIKADGGFAPLAPLLDRLVGTKVREKTGGRIRFFVSGGAALSPAVSDFYRALGLDVLQGYGLTETCAASCINHPGKNKPWTVGPPIKGVEVGLADDGEILIRGRSVMQGYYNLPEETAKAIDAEGWFHTGDIGAWDGEHLKITDRKKDLLVLANGKNIAPQALENRLKESDYINEAVVLGDGSPYCYALIVPEFTLLAEVLRKEGATVSTQEEISAHEKSKAILKAEIDRINATLADFEKIKKFSLLPKMLTVDDGELTPSMKVKRKVVKEKYQAWIDPMVDRE